MKHSRLVASFAVAVLAVAGLAIAQQPDAPQMSPEEQAVMEAWMKAGTPGEHHKLLEPFVGSWDTTVSWWEKPGAPAQVHTGVAESTWILGGRWVQQSFKGDSMEMPFEGLGYTGYDNYKGKFNSTWMDSMSTSIMATTGTGDGKSFTFTGEMDDVVKKKTMRIRETIKVVDANKHVMEMFGPGPDGKEYRMMEIVYKRK